MGGDGTDKLILSAGSHTLGDDDKLSEVEEVEMNVSDSSLDLSAQAEGFTITGGAGIDSIKGGAGDDIITGSGSGDTFHIVSGTDAITDLATTDNFIVSSGAVLNATNISAFVADDTTSNSGTANLGADNSNATIDMRLASSGGYSITGGSGSDNLYGGVGQDVFIITTSGDEVGDVYDGGAETDLLKLASGNITFADDSSLVSIEQIEANSSGGTINLSGQTEGFTITGTSSVDIITGGAGDDSIIGGGGNDTFNIVSGTDEVQDLNTLDVFTVSASATLNATGIVNFSATNSSSNSGTAILTTATAGGSIDMSNVGGTLGYTLIGNINNDQITGSTKDDIFEVKSAGAADGDNIDGGGGTDTLKLSSGTHTFANDGSVSYTHLTLPTICSV